MAYEVGGYFFDAEIDQETGTYDRIYDSDDVTGYLKDTVGAGILKSAEGGHGLECYLLPGGSVTGAITTVGCYNGTVFFPDGRKLTYTDGSSASGTFSEVAWENCEISQADPSDDRRDLLIVYEDLETRTCGFDVLTGTPSEGAFAPALTQNDTRWEYQLAEVYVPAGAVTSTELTITDLRGVHDTYSPWVYSVADIQAEYMPKSGGTFTGDVVIRSADRSQSSILKLGELLKGGGPGMIQMYSRDTSGSDTNWLATLYPADDYTGARWHTLPDCSGELLSSGKMDATPTSGSTNPVTSGGVYDVVTPRLVYTYSTTTAQWSTALTAIEAYFDMLSDTEILRSVIKVGNYVYHPQTTTGRYTSTSVSTTALTVRNINMSSHQLLECTSIGSSTTVTNRSTEDIGSIIQLWVL